MIPLSAQRIGVFAILIELIGLHFSTNMISLLRSDANDSIPLAERYL